MEMDDEMSSMNFGSGEMPQMPEGMEGFGGFGNFNPEDFSGSLPEGGNFSPWGGGELPEGVEPPEDMEPPEGTTMPGFGGNTNFDIENFASDAETKDVDIGNAHISVEIDGGKASGSMSDIQTGTFVTITMNGKGEVTNVLVSSQFSFGGGRSPAN